MGEFFTGIIVTVLCAILLYFVGRYRKKPKLRLLGSGGSQVKSPDGDIMDAHVTIYNDPHWFFVPVDRDTARIRTAIISEILDGLEIRRGDLFWKLPDGSFRQSIDIPPREQVELIVFWKLRYSDDYFIPEISMVGGLVGGSLTVSKARLSGEVKSYRIQVYDTDDRIYKFDVVAVDHPQGVNIRQRRTLSDRGDLIRDAFSNILRAIDWRN